MPIDLAVAGAFYQRINRFVDTTMREKVEPHFALFAEWHVEQGTRDRTTPYTIAVDGQLVPDKRAIKGAKRRVYVNFLETAVQMAAAELASVLRAEIKSTAGEYKSVTKRGGKASAGLIASEVVCLHVHNGVDTRITNTNQIKKWSPDDYIVLTSDNPWQVYLNSPYANGRKRGHKGGFFGRAAKKIRTKLGIRGKSQTGLRVRAVRRQFLWRYVDEGQLTSYLSDQARYQKKRGFGLWAIIIEEAKANTGVLGVQNRG